MPRIEDLPTELLLLVFEFLDPASHFDFCLTSTTIARRAKDVLAHHRQWEVLYGQRTISSTEKGNIFGDMLDDRAAAFHIRDLLIRDNLDVSADVSRALTSNEKWDIMDHIFDEFSDCPAHTDAALRDICRRHEKTGGFFPGRMRWAFQCPLALCLLPRLRSLELRLLCTVGTQARESHLLWNINYMVCEFSRQSFTPSAGWPGAYGSLTELNCSAEHPRSGFSPEQILNLMLLPSLKKLSVQRMRTWATQTPDDAPILGSSRHTSHVTQLYFKQASGNNVADFIERMIQTAPELTSIIFHDCSFARFNMVVRALHSIKSGYGLRRLIFSGNNSDITTDNNAQSLFGSALEGLYSLQVLTVDPLDMLPAGSRRSIIEMEYGHETPQESASRFARSIPSSLEVLILQKTPSQRLSDNEMQNVAMALALLLRSRRCSRLHAIYADNFEDGMREQRCTWGQFTVGNWLRVIKSLAPTFGVTFYDQDDIGATDRFLGQLPDIDFDQT